MDRTALSGLADWGTSDDHSNQTRSVYHRQHMRIAGDQQAMSRFIGMFPAEYFGLGDDWFQGKRVLDAGCGDTAKLLIALHRLGATDIHGLDLGTDFIPIARESLERYGVPHEQMVTLTPGSVTELPYPDASFDFVACHGVLVHLNNVDEVATAMSELARVTRPGGYLYTVFGVVGGMWEDAIFPALRAYYHENEDFRRFIDNVEPEQLHAAIDMAVEGMAEHTGERPDLDAVKALLDVDLVVLWQNIIQAPVRLRIEESQVRGWYREHGLEDPRRLRRFVKRTNIRKYFAPFHYGLDHPLRGLLYGSGNLEFLGRKS